MKTKTEQLVDREISQIKRVNYFNHLTYHFGYAMGVIEAAVQDGAITNFEGRVLCEKTTAAAREKSATLK